MLEILAFLFSTNKNAKVSSIFEKFKPPDGQSPSGECF